jgi:hypothetical protein
MRRAASPNLFFYWVLGIRRLINHPAQVFNYLLMALTVFPLAFD